MRDTLETLTAFPPRLTAAIAGLDETALHALEREGGWSVADVVAHLGDLELVYAVRIRTIVAGAGETPLAALDQNAWIERVHRREPFAELLELFRAQRAYNVAFLERLTDEELDRSGIHPQYGPITVRGAAERLVRHDAKHLAQLERIKAAV
ncbi:MAG TPA: DinB family protein [Thermoanaerobaculia bacterium]